MIRHYLLLLFILPAIYSNAQTWKAYSDSAVQLSKQRDFAGAIDAYAKAKNLLQADAKLSDDYVQLCTAFGVVYASMGDAGNAAPLFAEAKSTAETLHGKTDKAYARATTFLANIYSTLGRYKEAEDFYLEAKDIREKLYGKKETEEYAQTCNNLAELYRTTGAFEKAEPLATEAREIRRSVWSSKHPSYAISTTALANLYRDMGQYEKAEPLYREARQIRLDTFGRLHQDYASSCNILADLYFYMSRYNEAESLYLEAREIREQLYKTTVNASYAQSCNNLASLYLLTGRYKEAEKLALQASEIWRQTLPEGHENHAIGFANLGNIYFESGNDEKAESYYQKARKTWAASLGKVHFNYISYTINLAKVYWNQKKTDAALRLFSEAIALQKKQIDQFFTFTNEREKEAFLGNVLNAGNEYYSFLYHQPLKANAGLAYDLSLVKRNLILNSLQQLLSFAEKEESPATRELYRQWRTVKTTLAAALSEGSFNVDETKTLEEKASGLEKELVKVSAAFRVQQAQSVGDFGTIQQQLKPGEAAIEFIVFDDFNGRRFTGKRLYAALVLRKDRPNPVVVPLFEEKLLQQVLKTPGDATALYNSRGGGVENSSASTLSGLYPLLAKPLLKHLSGIRAVYFAPAGLLHRIAFAAIPIGNNQVFSDRFRLAQVTTTAAIGVNQKQVLTPADKLFLYGGVDYAVDPGRLKKAAAAQLAGQQKPFAVPKDVNRGDEWNPLPGTAQEVSAIEHLGRQKQFSAHIFRGNAATEESIKGLEATSSPAVLHIASHGFFFPDPLKEEQSPAGAGTVFRQSANPLFRSGLLLAGANHTWQGKAISGVEDGVLTAYEVASLSLRNTKLVVLSACETALGDIQGPEGVYGLQRAFKMAGANFLVMSLWKVPDAETAEFMQDFYKHLFDGKTISVAFSQAQDSMKNKYRTEPYKWAAWVLTR